MYKTQNVTDLTDLCTTGQTSAFHHGKDGSGDVAIDNGTLIKVAAPAVHITIHMTVDVNLTGFDIALDVSKLADGHLAGLRENLAIDLAINMHVILESNGTDNLDSLSQNICRIGAHVVIQVMVGGSVNQTVMISFSLAATSSSTFLTYLSVSF